MSQDISHLLPDSIASVRDAVSAFDGSGRLVTLEKEYRQEWIAHLLCKLDYDRLSREDKGIVRVYIQNETGYSRARTARLIKTGLVHATEIQLMEQSQNFSVPEILSRFIKHAPHIGVMTLMIGVTTAAALVGNSMMREESQPLEFLNASVLETFDEPATELNIDPLSAENEQSFVRFPVETHVKTVYATETYPLFFQREDVSFVRGIAVAYEKVVALTADELKQRVAERRNKRLLRSKIISVIPTFITNTLKSAAPIIESSKIGYVRSSIAPSASSSTKSSEISSRVNTTVTEQISKIRSLQLREANVEQEESHTQIRGITTVQTAQETRASLASDILKREAQRRTERLARTPQSRSTQDQISGTSVQSRLNEPTDVPVYASAPSMWNVLGQGKNGHVLMLVDGVPQWTFINESNVQELSSGYLSRRGGGSGRGGGRGSAGAQGETGATGATGAQGPAGPTLGIFDSLGLESTGSLEAGDAGGRNLFNLGLLTASGKLIVEDDVRFNSGVILNSVSYLFPSADGSNTQVLSTDGNGNLSWVNAGGGGSSKWTDSGDITYLTNQTDDLAIGGTDPSAPFYFDVSESTFYGTTLSGSAIFADLRLASSGSLAVDGIAYFNEDAQFGSGIIIENITYRFPQAQGGSGTVLSTDGNGNLTWTSVTNQVQVGQGLTNDGSAIFLTATLTGTSLEIFGSISGATIHASSSLTTSGNLIVEGDATIRGTLSGGQLTSTLITDSTFSGGVVQNATLSGVTLIGNISADTIEASLLSGDHLHANRLLTSSGTLIVEGNARFNSGVILNGVTYTFPFGDGSASGKVLATDGAGNLSWTDAGSNTFAGQGLTKTGDFLSLSATITGSLANFQTLSGSDVFAANSLRSSGTLVVEGNSTLNGDLTVAGTTTFTGDLTASTIEATTLLSGATIHAQDILRSSGSLLVEDISIFQAGISGTDAVFSGTVSGSSLYAVKSINSSGSLNVEGDTFIHGTLSGNTITGFNLTDCNGASNKLVYNAANQRFECETDQNTDTDSNFSGTGSLQNFFDNRYVNTSGDTMTGALVINPETGTLALELNGSLSGTTIAATTEITSSGTLIVEGNARFNSGVILNGVTYIFPFGDGSASGKVLATDGAGQLSWTDAASNTFAGQGLTLANNFLSLNATLTGTDILALTSLRSSGTLVVAGETTLSGATTINDEVTFGSGIIIENIIYRFPQAQGGSGTVLATDGNGNLIWTSTTNQINVGQGLTNDGSAIFLTATLTGTSLEIFGSISGATLHTSDSITTSGTLVVENIAIFQSEISGTDAVFSGTVSGSSLYAVDSINSSGSLNVEGDTFIHGTLSGNTITGFNLTDCNGASNKLVYNAANQRFECETDQNTDTNTQFSGTGSLQNFFDNRYVNTSGDTMTGALVINPETGTIALELNGNLSGTTIAATTAITSSGTLIVEGATTLNSTLVVAALSTFNAAISGTDAVFSGTVSGSSLYAVDSINSSGSLNVEGDTFIHGTLSGNTIVGFNLTDCDNATTSKLLWDATTQMFSCGADQGGSNAPQAGQGLTLNGDNFFSVNETVTGSLANFQTISGSDVFAANSLRSSGTLVVARQTTLSGATTINDEVTFGSGIIIENITYRFPQAQGGSGTVLATDGNGNLTWTDVSDDTQAGQGLTAANGFLSLNATLTGTDILALNSLRSSGTLVVAGTSTLSGATTFNDEAIFNSGVILNGVTYTFPFGDGSATGKVLKTDGAGQLSWSDDLDNDTTYSAGQGISIDGSNVITLNAAITGSSLEIFGSISGATVHASTSLTSSGTLVVEGNSTLNGDLTVAGTTTFTGDLTASTIEATTLLSGATVHAQDLLTTSGSLIVEGATTLNSTLIVAALSTFNAAISGTDAVFSGTVSGSSLYAVDSINSSGSLNVEGDTFIHGTLSGNTITGFNLTDCDNATTSKLLWDATTQTFSCGTDTDTDSDSQFSGTGSLQDFFDNRYVNTSGDTMTGALVINPETGTLALELNGTLSGTTIAATTAITSSGTLIVEGNARFNSGVILNGVTYIFPFGDGSATGKVLKTDGNGNLSWSDDLDNDTTYSAGQGISIDGSNVITLNATITGSSLEFTTISGGTIHAQDGLTSSGTLVVEGNSTLNGDLTVAGTTTFNGNLTASTIEVTTLLSGATIHAQDILRSSGSLLVEDISIFQSEISGTDAVFSGTVSGSSLYAVNSINSSGSLNVEGDTFIHGTLSGNTITGFNLTDCNGAANKLVYNAANQRFECETDQNTDTDSNFSGTGSLQNFFDNRYVNESGDTMTGALVINPETGTLALELNGTLSGTIIAATTAITSSGTLAVEGETFLQDEVTFGSGIIIENITYRFPQAQGGSGTVLATDGNGNLTWTDVSDDTQAGQGLTAANGFLSLNATLTGTDILALNSLRSSGTLVVAGTSTLSGATTFNDEAIFNSGVILNGVTYTFPFGDGSATGKVLKTDGAGQLSWSDDLDNDTTYSAGQGISIDGSNVITLNAAITGSSLEIFGSISGATVHASTSLTSSGTLVVEGNSTLNGDLTVAGTTTFTGDLTASTIEATTLLSGATVHAQDLLTTSGSLIVEGATTLNSTLIVAALSTFNAAISGTDAVFSGTVSGSSLYAVDSINSSGSLNVEGDTFIHGTLSGNTITGFNLTDCNGASNKLVYNAANQRFECETDQNTDTDSNFSGTGSLQDFFDNRYVNESGDTMTGALVINPETGTLALELNGSLSGTTIAARTAITSSGTLIVEGNARFNSGVILNGVTYIFPFGDGSASGKVLATDGAGQLSWTDGGSGGGNSAGQGLTLANNFLSLNATLTGTLIDFQTISGSTIKASSGIVISTEENKPFITLHDKTNDDSVSMTTGTGDPNGTVSAQLGSLFFASDTGKIWKNNDGATTWVELTTGSGTVHMAKMTRDAAQSISSSTTTKIAFDAEEFDVGNIADFTTNDRFDIKKSGKYLVTASITLNAAIDDQEGLIGYIYKNGSVWKAMQNHVSSVGSNSTHGVEVTDVLDLVAGDYIEMYIFHNEGGSVNTSTGAGSKPRMSVTQLDAALGASVWTVESSNAEYAGTASASHLHAQDLLTSSGTLIVEGNARFNSGVILNGVTYTFPFGDGSASGKVLATDGAGQLSWTDAGSNTFAGQGLTLANNFLSLNATITGTSLHVSDRLASSGELVVASTARFQSGVILSGHLLPQYTNTFDLGSTDKRFRDLYLSGGTIDLGGATIQSGFGSPENVHSAGTGSLYLDRTNGRLYIKQNRNDAIGWEYLSDGAGASAFGTKLLHLQDQKASGTSGGTFTSGDWRTRDLNTTLTNEITGSALSSNQITLPAGTYYVEWSAPAHRVNRNQSRLYNVTDDSVILVGTSENDSSTYSSHVASLGNGRFTLSASKTLELQHRAQSTKADNGFGVESGSNFTVEHETYSDIRIWDITNDTSLTGATLQTAYNADPDGGSAVINLNSNDDSIQILNPSSGGTDSGAVLYVTNLDTSILAAEILGTTSGTHLHAQDLLTSSGTLIVEGNARFNSGVILNGVTYTFPFGDGSASGKVLATDGAGQLSWTDAASNTFAGQGLTLANNFLSLNATLTGTLIDFQTISGSTIRASSGIVISTEENKPFITLHDKTNDDSVSMTTGTGDPNGTVSAQLGSLFFASDTGKIWKNNDGATQWSELTTGSGTVHMAKMTRDAAQTITDSLATKITFDNEDFDIGNIADFSTNDRFDIKKSGKYLISTSFSQLSDSNVDARGSVYIYVNGVAIREFFSSSSQNLTTMQGNAVLDLSVGDYIEMYAYLDSSSGTFDTETGDAYKPEMSVTQLDAALGASVWTVEGSNAEYAGTASASHLHAQDLLTSSGTLIVEGNARFNSGVILNGVTYTFPFGDGSASGKVLATDGAGQLSWTDGGSAATQAGQGLTLANNFLSLNATLTGTLIDFQTISGSTIRASSGIVISTEEDKASITLHDITNDDSVSIRTGSGSPHGVVSAQLGSLYTDHNSGKIYKNNNGATDWVELTTGSGTVHMAKMTRDAAQSIPNDSFTKIAFDAEEFDIGNIADFSTNDRFDITKSGKYLVSALGGVGVDNANTQIAIYKNGSIFAKVVYAESDSLTVVTSISEVMDLVVGDYLELYILQSSGSAQNTLTTTETKPRMSVVQLDGALGASVWTVEGSNAEYAGTASASHLHAQDLLTSSGLLVIENTVRFNSGANIAGSLLPTISNSYDLGSDDRRWRDLYLSGGTIHLGDSGNEAIILYNTAEESLGFDINGNGSNEFEFMADGTVSGARFSFNNNLSLSGALVVEEGQTITLNGVTYTFPASDGSASGKVLATDGAGNLSWTDGGSSDGLTESAADDRYVNTSGDTMTGALIIRNEGSDPALNVAGTMSGRSLWVSGTGASPLLYTDVSNGIISFGSSNPDSDAFAYIRARGDAKTGLVVRGTTSDAVIPQPSEISNLQLWVRADDLSLDDDDPVTTWSDVSGNGNDLAESGSQRPTFKTNIINGKPVIRFDGTDDVLTDTSFGTTSMDEMTVFMVMTPLSNPGGFEGLVSTRSTGDDFVEGFVLDQGASSQSAFNYLNVVGVKNPATNVDLKSTSDAFGTFNILTVDYHDADTTLYVNGTEDGSRASDTDSVATTQVRIGARFYASNEQAYINADFAEILIYDKALSDTERANVETYLSDKYNITVSSFNAPGSIANIQEWQDVGGSTVASLSGSGFLAIGNDSAETALEVVGTASASHLHAQDLLTSSGTLAIEGETFLQDEVTFGSGIIIENITYRFPQAQGNSGTVLATDGNGNLTWTSTTNQVQVGQGLTNDGSFISLNATLTGTSLEIFGSISGATIHASSAITSSGTLVVEGNARFNSGVILNGVTYTFPASDGSASGKVLATDGAGTLSWTDAGSNTFAGQGLTLANNFLSLNATLTGTLIDFQTISGSTIKASSGIVISTEENKPFITLHDKTNDDSVSMTTGTGDPNGTVSAQLGSLFFASDTGKIWKNNDGGTTWVELTTGSGTVHMAKMTRDAAQSIPNNAVTKIAFDNEDYDIGNIADFSTNDRFDIKKTGKYLVTGMFNIGLTLDSGETVIAYIYVNGSEVIQSYKQASNTSSRVTAELVEVLELTAGDYVEMFVYHNEGSAQNTETVLGRKVRMSVTQLDAALGASVWTVEGSNAEYAGTASASHLHAQDLLTTSGSLVVEEGQTVTFNGVTYTFPASDGSASGKVLATDGAGNLSWTDGGSGGGNSAGQGLTLANSFLSLNANITGTSLHVSDRLASSGELVVASTARFQSGIILSGHLLPQYTNTFDLGSTDKRFRDLYLSGGTIHLGNTSQDALIGYNTTSDSLTFNIEGANDSQLSLTSGAFLTLSGSNLEQRFINGEYARITRNSGNNALTFSNRTTTPTSSDGPIGNAVDFDGSDDYVDTGAKVVNDFETAAISLWFKGGDQTSASASGIRPFIMQGEYLHLSMIRAGLGDHGKLVTRWGSNGATHQMTSTDAYNDDEWHHVVMVKTSATTTELYVDGVEIDTGAAENTLDAGNTEIGADSSNVARKFDGLIDDVRIYDNSISASEVSELYNGGAGTAVGPTSNLVGHWRFDEESGTDAVDSTGNNNATLENGATFTTGIVPQLGTFDEVDIFTSQDGLVKFSDGIIDTQLVGTSIKFLTNSSETERLRITSGGLIGIGTTTPTEKLEVVGTVSGSHVYATDLLTTSGALIVHSRQKTGSGAATILAAEFQTGAYIYGSGAAVLALNSYEESFTADPINSPHILFGYRNLFDTAFYRWSGATLAMRGSLLPESDNTYDLGGTGSRFRDLYLGPNTIHIGATGDEATISYDTNNNTLAISNPLQVKDTTNNDSSTVHSGSGSPIGVVSAQLGSIYMDNYKGGIYVKKTGDGTNGGWQEVQTGSGSMDMAKMTRDAAQSIPNNTVTKVAFDDEDFDIGDFADFTTNDRFDIQKAGKYLINASWLANGASDGVFADVQIYVNGSAVHAHQVPWNGNLFGISAAISAVLDLSVGDFVEMYVRHNRGSALNTLTSDLYKPRMSVTQLNVVPGADIAEIYGTYDDSISAGDVVSINPSEPALLKKSSGKADTHVVGIVTTQPGMVLGGDYTPPEGARPVVLGLAGRVPVKVTTENGPIVAGDKLSPASQSGFAMKSDGTGPTIGLALEGHSGEEEGLVMTFIQNESVNASIADQLLSITGSTLKVDASLLSLSGALLVNGASEFRDTVSINMQTESGAVTAFNIIQNTSAGDNETFRVTADGNIYTDGTFHSSGADYAEWFASSESLQEGEVVCIDVTSDNTVKRCTEDADSNVMGIVSSNPAFIGNSITGASGILPPGYELIGLIGQVDTKVIVADYNGDPMNIRPGDALTAAHIPGYARRALPGEPTVGVALEGHSGSIGQEGSLNVLISRRNSSVTVDQVEQEVLDQIASMEIDDEVQIMVSQAVENISLDEEISEEVASQFDSLDIEEAVRSILEQSEDANDSEEEFGSGSQVWLVYETLKSQILDLEETVAALSGAKIGRNPNYDSVAIEETLITGGDTRVAGDLFVDGALNIEDLLLSGLAKIDGSIDVGGTLKASALDLASGATIRGPLNIEGQLLIQGEPFDLSAITSTGATMELSNLMIREGLEILGDVTILGDLTLSGALIISEDQAGYAVVVKTGTGVDVRFGSGTFATIPLVTASSNSFTPWRITGTSGTGFTIEVSEPAEEDITFTWHAMLTNNPRTTKGLPAGASSSDQPFYIDESGYPISSSDIWNACIRNQQPLDVSGEPFNCRRYRDDSDMWTHPDYLIQFMWDANIEDKDLRLIIPKGYYIEVVGEEVVEEDESEPEVLEDAEQVSLPADEEESEEEEIEEIKEINDEQEIIENDESGDTSPQTEEEPNDQESEESEESNDENAEQVSLPADENESEEEINDDQSGDTSPQVDGDTIPQTEGEPNNQETEQSNESEEQIEESNDQNVEQTFPPADENESEEETEAIDAIEDSEEDQQQA